MPTDEAHTLTPRMVVSDLEGAVGFPRSVFDGTGEVEAGSPAEIRIGDSGAMVRDPFGNVFQVAHRTATAD